MLHPNTPVTSRHAPHQSKASTPDHDARAIDWCTPDYGTVAKPAVRTTTRRSRPGGAVHPVSARTDGHPTPESGAYGNSVQHDPARAVRGKHPLPENIVARDHHLNVMCGHPSLPRHGENGTVTNAATICSDSLATPLGLLRLVATDNGLSGIHFPSRDLLQSKRRHSHPILEQTKRELTDYFEGRLTRFTVPLCWKGTPFQEAVWTALLAIPFGQTVSYADIASAVGRPRSARPVGGAVGRNPIPIIVPCHRVVGSDQTLTGFTGGLRIKETLLKLEGFAISG